MTTPTSAPLPDAPSPVHFMGLDLHLRPGSYVPRDETELLVSHVLTLVPGSGDGWTMVDMCCGTGTLSCVLASRLPGLRVHAVDILQDHVEAARSNAARLGLSDRVTVAQGDMFSGLDPDLRGKVDIVVSNPPYISTSRLAGDRAHLLEAEPREAFDGGPYGISILQALVAEAPGQLRPGGILALEFGEGQHRQMPILFRRSGRYASHGLVDDAQGVPRLAVGWTRPSD